MKGHVRKRGNTWTAVVFIGFGDDGKRKYKWYGGFRKEKDAQKFLRDKIGEIESGIYIEASKETLAGYLTDWLEMKQTQVRLRTYENLESQIRNHIAPALGRVMLTELRPQQIQKFYYDLGEKLSPHTIVHIHRLLHDALSRAVKWRLIAVNPIDAVDPPKYRQTEFVVWSAEEIRTFLAASESNQWYIFFLIAITTGMRMSEIMGLQWKDVDFERRRLRVNRTLTFPTKSEERYLIQEPKTKKSKREVTVPIQTIDALREHRKQQIEQRLAAGGEYRDLGFIIANPDGTPPRPVSIRRAFRKACEAAGVPRIRVHDLRHTHATMGLENGIHAKVMAERLGHSKIGTLLDIYTHVLPNIQEQAAEQMGNAIFEDKPKGKSTKAE